MLCSVVQFGYLTLVFCRGVLLPGVFVGCSLSLSVVVDLLRALAAHVAFLARWLRSAAFRVMCVLMLQAVEAFFFDFRPTVVLQLASWSGFRSLLLWRLSR